MVDLSYLLPRFNAACNFSCVVCLMIGYRAVVRGQVQRHRRAMLSALMASALFLCGYLSRMALYGGHRFAAHGPWRTAYLAMLVSHMILAVVMLPMIARAIFLAWRQRFAEHRRLARWTWPIWMYVSITGVLVYVALYHLDPYLVAASQLAMP